MLKRLTLSLVLLVLLGCVTGFEKSRGPTDVPKTSSRSTITESSFRFTVREDLLSIFQIDLDTGLISESQRKELVNILNISLSNPNEFLRSPENVRYLVLGARDSIVKFNKASSSIVREPLNIVDIIESLPDTKVITAIGMTLKQCVDLKTKHIKEPIECYWEIVEKLGGLKTLEKLYGSLGESK